MWKELVEIFGGEAPLHTAADQFLEMLQLTHAMAERVWPHVNPRSLEGEAWSAVLADDEQVNRLEVSVRRALVSRLALQSSQVPYCLKLYSLVKDAERLGEYVKNIAEESRRPASALPAGPLRDEFAELLGQVLGLFGAAQRVLTTQDREASQAQVRTGLALVERCDALRGQVATTALDAAQASSSALLSFFLRRIISHLLNILSSVELSPHELDRYDERFAAETHAAG